MVFEEKSLKIKNEIICFLKNNVENIFIDTKVINNITFDLWIPDKKIGINFYELDAFREQRGYDRNFFVNNVLTCKENGIQLLCVFEDEWVFKPEIVKSVLLSKLGIFKKRYFARKCQIQLIDSGLKNTFLNKYHLQGKDNSSHIIGLTVGMKLLSLMTFGKRTIGGKKSVGFEMLRFCGLPNIQVIGGASKALKFFLRHYDIPKIKTFSDIRYSDGSFYEKIGFKFSHISNPNYWYIINNKRVHRVAYQKHKLAKKLENFDPQKTEYENVLNSGIDRVWDSGNYVFTIDRG